MSARFTGDLFEVGRPDEAIEAAFRAQERARVRWLRGRTAAGRPALALTMLAGILNGLLMIGQSALLAFALHAVIVEGAAMAAIVPAVAAIAGLVLVRAACVYTAEVAGAAAAAAVKRAVRRDLTGHIIARGPLPLRDTSAGALTETLVRGVEALDGYFARYLPQRIVASVLPIAMIMVVFPVNWVVGVIFLVAGPLIPLFMALVGFGAAAASHRQMETLTRMGGYFLDRLRALTTIRLFGQARAELGRVEAVSNDFRARTMAVLRVAFLSSAVLEFFSAISVALVAVYVGLGLLNLIGFGPAGEIGYFAALFVLLLAPDFFLPLRQLALHYHDRAAAVGVVDALQALETAGSQPATPAASRVQAPAPVAEVPLALDGVDLAYAGGARPVLRGFSLAVAPGERVALMGPSGAGKSSVLALAAGFVAPDAGTVAVFGTPVDLDDTAALHQVRRRLAWVGQPAHLFHGSLRDAVALGRPEAGDDAIAQALAIAGAADIVARLPAGLDTVVGERGTGLSGGEAQRIALARAVLRDAPLLLLDEPTANLDRETEARVLDALDRLVEGRAVLVATHSPAVAARCHRVVEIPIIAPPAAAVAAAVTEPATLHPADG